MEKMIESRGNVKKKTKILIEMKKRSKAMQTLRTGCRKADTQTNKHTDRQRRLQYTVPQLC